MPTAGAALFVAFLQSPAVDWPQFGGPNRDSRVTALASKFAWGETGPEVLWRSELIGPGFSGVAVQGGEVFVLDNELGESEIVRCLDLATGEEKWSVAYEAKGRVQFPGPRAVPAVTADAVYTCGALGKIVCVDRKTHEIRWEEHVAETYGGEDPGFGWSSSPLLVGDLVVFSPLGGEVGLVALDQKTGAERWTSAGVGFSQSSPAYLELLGEPGLVILATDAQATGQDLAAPMSITCIDPKDGSTRWRHVLTLTRLPVASAVQVDRERFFLTGGYKGGSTLVNIAKKDGAYTFEELFHVERGAQVHAPLLHDEHLYMLANENSNVQPNRRAEGGLVCLGLDGKEKWRSGNAPYFGLGNAILAGDHILVQDGDDGTLRVVKASPKGYEQVAEAKVFGEPRSRSEQMWAPMALAGDRLLLRSQDVLLCVEP
jgi:outer membrane protein assembly factor BamB